VTTITFRISVNLLAGLCLALSASAATPDAIDRGALDARSAATPISVTVALALPSLGEAEKLQESLYTPGDPQFHKFLTADQFVARFAPTDADIAKVTAALAKYGLTSEKTTATTLKVTGLPANLERAFSVVLHSFEVPAHDNVAGYTYHAPTSRPTVPAEISAAVAAVAGLDNSPALRPSYKTAPAIVKPAPTSGPSKTTGNPPGQWTVTDFAKYYDVDPLYRKGVTGRGRTIGVLTFAAFTPSDAFAYWEALGLNVSPGRITIVNVDGGPGAPSDASGSVETTLDVEQSGGLAPGANIIVYQAPNTLAHFVDLFAKAVDDNKADSLSTSWGQWEWLFSLEYNPVTDPITGKTVGVSQAVHEQLLRAAIQGQAAFAASGDGGAYDVNARLECFGPYSPSIPGSCSNTLSVDYPASDSFITAAGGTTLATVLKYCSTNACTGSGLLTINIPHEQVWGYDYLEPLCEAEGVPNPIECGIFPGGSGGGVSVMFLIPLYQLGIFGTQFSQPGQNFFYAGAGLVYALPPFYLGRNVPDISFNSDPDTGYVVYYTSSYTGELGIFGNYGGTSFTAQQLSGLTALLDQDLNGRIGLLNNSLYLVARTGQGYFGQNPAFHAMTAGDNWFYHGSFGYNPAAGLGTMDVANFAQTLHSWFGF
jgi:subtilase family serine protease